MQNLEAVSPDFKRGPLAPVIAFEKRGIPLRCLRYVAFVAVCVAVCSAVCIAVCVAACVAVCVTVCVLQCGRIREEGDTPRVSRVCCSVLQSVLQCMLRCVAVWSHSRRGRYPYGVSGMLQCVLHCMLRCDRIQEEGDTPTVSQSCCIMCCSV